MVNCALAFCNIYYAVKASCRVETLLLEYFNVIQPFDLALIQALFLINYKVLVFETIMFILDLYNNMF